MANTLSTTIEMRDNMTAPIINITNSLNAIYVLGRIKIAADSGFQGIAKIHTNSITPRKKSKNI